MRKVRIVTVGKIKEKWLEEAIYEYEKRLAPLVECHWILAKEEAQLKNLFSKEIHCIGLDPLGMELSSEKFSEKFLSHSEKNGGKISFVIGGANGLSSEMKEECQELWSLSQLTFTHQITRLILVEQIYRAMEISKGSGYHK